MFNFNKKIETKAPLGVSSLNAGDRLLSPQGLPFTVMAINNGVQLYSLIKLIMSLKEVLIKVLKKMNLGE